MVDELKPCPSGHTKTTRDNNNIYGAWWVKCAEGECSWRTAGDTEAEAVTAWNTRTPSEPTATDERVALAREHIAYLRATGAEWAVYADALEALLSTKAVEPSLPVEPEIDELIHASMPRDFERRYSLPDDDAGLVERLRYSAEHGLFKAVEDGKHCSYAEAADSIQTLSTALVEARAKTIEECAKIAEGARDWPNYQAPCDWDYGAQDAAVSIATALRHLNSPGDEG